MLQFSAAGFWGKDTVYKPYILRYTHLDLILLLLLILLFQLHVLWSHFLQVRVEPAQAAVCHSTLILDLLLLKVYDWKKKFPSKSGQEFSIRKPFSNGKWLCEGWQNFSLDQFSGMSLQALHCSGSSENLALCLGEIQFLPLLKSKPNPAQSPVVTLTLLC